MYSNNRFYRLFDAPVLQAYYQFGKDDKGMEIFNFSDYLAQLLNSARIKEKYSGNNLRERRERAGLSLRELAEQIGVTHPSVINWERGENHLKPENIAKLLMVFSDVWDMLLVEALRENQELKRYIIARQDEQEEE